MTVNIRLADACKRIQDWWNVEWWNVPVLDASGKGPDPRHGSKLHEQTLGNLTRTRQTCH
jgi:hypothetical protein